MEDDWGTTWWGGGTVLLLRRSLEKPTAGRGDVMGGGKGTYQEGDDSLPAGASQSYNHLQEKKEDSKPHKASCEK